MRGVDKWEISRVLLGGFGDGGIGMGWREVRMGWIEGLDHGFGL